MKILRVESLQSLLLVPVTYYSDRARRMLSKATKWDQQFTCLPIVHSYQQVLYTTLIHSLLYTFKSNLSIKIGCCAVKPTKKTILNRPLLLMFENSRNGKLSLSKWHSRDCTRSYTTAGFAYPLLIGHYILFWYVHLRVSVTLLCKCTAVMLSIPSVYSG